jgi:arylsulfatase A-like enzyme
MKNTHATRKTIRFLALGVILVLLVFLGIWLFQERRRCLQGNVIRLIDETSEACILRSPLIMPLRSVRKELLDQGWIKLGSLDSGIAIWQTSASRFIVSPSDQFPDTSQRIYRRDRVLKHQPDMWNPKTAADCWTSRDNQIFISAGKGVNPNRERYFADYKTLGNTGLVMVKEEKLDSPPTYAHFHDGQTARRLVVFPVRYPMWKHVSGSKPFKTVVRQNQQALPFRQGFAERFNPPNEKSLAVYPSASSPVSQPYPLFKSSDRLSRPIHLVPGPYIIKLTARASLAGSQPPLAVIRLNSREVARLPIASEDWQTYYVSVFIEQADTELCVGFPNDYTSPHNRRDRNIFISEILLWPDEASDEVRLKAAPGRSLPATWSWLDDGQEIFSQETSPTIFRMFNKKDVYSLKRYCQLGIVSFLITASADLAGEEKPRLAVYLDKKQVGAIQVEDNTFRQYTLRDIPVTAGWHVMEAVFENDFYDRETRKDRNIFLRSVALKRQSAVMVSEPADKPPGSYTISYPSKADFLNQLHLYRRYSSQETDRVNLLAWRIDQEGEIRKALVCPPQTRLVFRIKVPPSGKLRFGHSIEFVPVSQTESQGASGLDELTIKLKEVFHASRTIFCLKIADFPPGRASPWKDEVLDLGAFAGKKIEIFIERPSRDRGLVSHPDLFISNPVVSADSRRVEGDPNVMIISADALRADHLSCYGYGRRTSPHIDQFAGESIVFQSAISQASWTLPSFVSLFTSLEPSFHGILQDGVKIHSSVKTLPKILRENGYLTAASVDNPHLSPAMGLAEGFDFYSYGNPNVEGQLATVEGWLEAMKGQKFFLFFHLISTHLPYEPPAPFTDVFRKGDRPIYNASFRNIYELDRMCKRLSLKDRTDLIALYDGEILYLDDMLRRLFDFLKQLGLYRDTVVIFISDHGEQFQEHGYFSHGKTLYREEIHVPLIMKLPAGFPYTAKRISADIRLMDLFPTILDILKIQYSGFIRGKSLVPLLRDQAFEENMIFSELHSFGRLAIKKDQYKYIYTDQKRCAWSMKNIDRHDCWPRAAEELYDLKEDPAEMRNIAADRPDLLDRFRKERMHFVEISRTFRQNAEKAKEDERPVLDRATKERLRALGYIR